MERLITNTRTDDWSKVGLQDYSLVAIPDKHVFEKVMQEKQNFFAQYKQKPAVETKPHITIATFVAREEMEETISRYVHRILVKQESFEVALNNYSGFPPHSVYVRVQNPERFRRFGKELKAVDDYISSCFCPPLKLATNPHVSIAKRLPESLYLKVMMDYSRKTFHETFMVNELVLLKRGNEYETGKAINVFRLHPPANTLYN
ncbi:MAG TPA: 2'-5' RNA ligase family protein [Segetibacter sp.]|jgi:2'-5' RNA ligase